MQLATGFKPRQIVQDKDGNHFKIIKPIGNGLIVQVESVATKELFNFPVGELFESNRKAF